MIRLKSENKLEFSGKRTLQVDSNEEPVVAPKRISLFKRLQDVTSDRQEQATKVVIVK